MKIKIVKALNRNFDKHLKKMHMDAPPNSDPIAGSPVHFSMLETPYSLPTGHAQPWHLVVLHDGSGCSYFLLRLALPESLSPNQRFEKRARTTKPCVWELHARPCTVFRGGHKRAT
jgi:hypothetical protein